MCGRRGRGENKNEWVQEDVVRGRGNLGGFESASWSAMRGNLAVCVVCV